MAVDDQDPELGAPYDAELDVGGPWVPRRPSVHRWFARRDDTVSAAAVALGLSPELAGAVAEGLTTAAPPDKAEHPPDDAQQLQGVRVLDLCSGGGSISAVAARMGASVTAIDRHPLPVLIGRAELEYPSALADPLPTARGSAADGSWRGLAAEVEHWAQRVIDEAEVRSGSLWLTGLDCLLFSRRLVCPSCSEPQLAQVASASGPSHGIQRGQRECGRCGHRFALRDQPVAWEATSAVRDGEEVPLPEGLISVLEAAGYPSPVREQLDGLWAEGRRGLISVGQATTPRQATVVQHLRDAVRSARDKMADLGYEPQHSAAILTYLALMASHVVDLLSTFTRWNPRARRVDGMGRLDWVIGPEMAEIGGEQLRKALIRSLSSALKVIERGKDLGVVSVQSGEMEDLAATAASFDLVVWDPPYFDNIDYERLAYPWTSFLRSVIGDLDPTLRWPSVTAGALAGLRFDPVAYQDSLRRAASEVARVLVDGGHLAVLWTVNEAHAVEDLDQMLGLFSPAGLELLQSIRLRWDLSTSGRAITDPRHQLLLVFRRTQVARPVEAEQLLEGAGAGKPMMVEGLVQVLLDHLDPDELEDHIPSNFKGSLAERLAEVVLTRSAPEQLLELVAKKDLMQVAESRGLEATDMAGLDRAGLAREVFRSLGWAQPRTVGFTIGGALEEATVYVDNLRLAKTEETIRGSTTAAFSRVEDVLRFSVTAWAVAARGREWREALASYECDPDRASFGTWRRVFGEVPKDFAQEHASIGKAAGQMRKLKIGPSLDEVVGLRNRVAHPEALDWTELRAEAVAALDRVLNRLRDLDEAGALPTVFQPLEEVRDPYGRITLRLVGHGGRPAEFLMTRPTDLANPLIVLRGITNPREVDPVCLDANEVLEQAGLAEG